MATKSVRATASSVRAKPKTTNPKVPSKIHMERPTTGGIGGSGGSRTGHVKASEAHKVTNFSSGMSSGKKPVKQRKKQSVESVKSRALALQSKVQGQATDLTVPTPSNDEKIYLEEYMHLFEMLQKMIRISEERYLDSNSTREIYAMMTMYSQLREVIADIRSISNMSDHANHLIDQVIQPSISSIAQSFVDIFYHIRLLIRETARDDQVQYGIRRVDEMMRDSGLLLQDQYEKISERIHEILSE